MGAKGLARAKVAADGTWTQSPLGKTVTPELRTAINERTGAKEGDLILFQFGKDALVHTVMANLRVHLGKKLGLIPEIGHGGKFELPVGHRPAALRVRRGARSAGRRRTTPSPARTTSTSTCSRTIRARCSATATIWC